MKGKEFWLRSNQISNFLLKFLLNWFHVISSSHFQTFEMKSCTTLSKLYIRFYIIAIDSKQWKKHMFCTSNGAAANGFDSIAGANWHFQYCFFSFPFFLLHFVMFFVHWKNRNWIACSNLQHLFSLLHGECITQLIFTTLTLICLDGLAHAKLYVIKKKCKMIGFPHAECVCERLKCQKRFAIHKYAFLKNDNN